MFEANAPLMSVAVSSASAITMGQWHSSSMTRCATRSGVLLPNALS